MTFLICGARGVPRSAPSAGGYRVAAPELRGFGRSERPERADLYDNTVLVDDVVDLLKKLGETSAVIIGHDIGANLVNAAAMMRPDLFRAVVALGTSPAARAPVKPSVIWKTMENRNIFYQHYFQDHKADHEMASHPRRGAETWRS